MARTNMGVALQIEHMDSRQLADSWKQVSGARLWVRLA